MKTGISNQKDNLERLTKVLGIGALMSLGFKANEQWIAEFTSSDDVIKENNTWFPIHNCFISSATFYLFPS